MSTAVGMPVHTYLGDYNNYSHLAFLAIPFYSDNHSHIALYISELDLISIHFPPLSVSIFCLVEKYGYTLHTYSNGFVFLKCSLVLPLIFFYCDSFLTFQYLVSLKKEKEL